MISFLVTARTPTASHSYIAIGMTSIDVHMSALDRFENAVYISVVALKRRAAC